MSPLRAAPIAPSQLTAPTYQPPQIRAVPSGVEIADGAGPAPPPGAERLRLRLGRVDVAGGFAELASADAEAVRKLGGRDVSVSEIFAASATLEQAYAAAGYLLARVSVPPQRLVDGGPLKLAVTDGFIEAVDVEGVPDAQRDFVRPRLAVLVGRRHVRLREIERALLIAGDAPGLTLQSAIARGLTPGGAKLVVQGVQKSVAGSVVIDNRLPGSLGGAETTATLSVNDELRLGEQVYVTAGSDLPLDLQRIDSAHYDVFAIGGSAPIGFDSLTLAPEYTHSQARPEAAAGAPATLGEFNRAVVRAAYYLQRDRAHYVKLGAELGFIEQTTSAPGFGVKLNSDAYAFARAKLSASGVVLGGAQASGDLEFSQGLTGRDGDAAAASGVPLSRLGASPWFHKAVIDARLSQPLPEALRLDVIARGQWSFGRPVFVSEQVSLDGPDALSPFASGALSADSGATLRAELTRSFTSEGGLAASTWSPYLFSATGFGRLETPTALEVASPHAAAFGVGLRTQFDGGDGRAAFAGAEAGREFSNATGETSGYRLSLNLAVQF